MTNHGAHPGAPNVEGVREHLEGVPQVEAEIGVDDVNAETGEVTPLPEPGNTEDYYVECVGMSPAEARERVETVVANRDKEIVRQIEAAAEMVRPGRRGGAR